MQQHSSEFEQDDVIWLVCKSKNWTWGFRTCRHTVQNVEGVEFKITK